MSVKHLYAAYRRKGWRAREALRAARIEDEWRNLEADGVVRLRTEPDEICSYDDLAGDFFDVELNGDSVPDGARTIRAQEKAFKEQIERDGVWGVIGEFKCPVCDEWPQADSCWGFVGDD